MLRISNIFVEIDVVNTNYEVEKDCRIAKSLAQDELPHSDGEEWELIGETLTPVNCTHHFKWRLKPDTDG